MNTEQLRRAFLVEDLFQPGTVNLVATDLDRITIGAAMPEAPLRLPSFNQRRETGVLNLGEAAAIRVGETLHELAPMEFLYAGLGEAEMELYPPGVFYLASCPAHVRHPSVKVSHGEAETATIGDAACASRRTIRKYIAAGIVSSCQLVMGYTELSPGSVWNTMPAHTHSRRSEIYLYLGLDSAVVFHFMGQPGESRHLVVRDRQAVLSPAWSIHSGAGTASYRFVWAMAGENQDFNDIDPVAMRELR
jgi:4-deoxy-L-threo-5-hexosulose-uronate ketol-isomerase